MKIHLLKLDLPKCYPMTVGRNQMTNMPAQDMICGMHHAKRKRYEGITWVANPG